MLETICDIFKEGYSRGWITSRDGNASIRYREQNHFYVTPSGTRKQYLQPEMFKKLSLSGEVMKYTAISQELRPSGELPMHFGLQRNIDTDVRIVLHMHPTYVVAAMYAGIDLAKLADEFPELSRYTSVAPTVPLIPPITQELADACLQNLVVFPDGGVKFNIVGMDRHGVIAVDTSPWRAFEHIERINHICQMVLAGRK